MGLKALLVFTLFLRTFEILLLFGHYVGLLLSCLIYLDVEQANGNFISLSLPSSYLVAPLPLYLVMIIIWLLFVVLWVYEMHLATSTSVAIGTREAPTFIKFIRVLLMGVLIASFIIVAITLIAYLALSVRNQETAIKMNYVELPGLSFATLTLMIIAELGSMSLVFYMVKNWVQRIALSRSDTTSSVFLTFPSHLTVASAGEPRNRLLFDTFFRIFIFWSLGLSVAFHCHGSMMTITRLTEYSAGAVIGSFVAALVFSVFLSICITAHHVHMRKRELSWTQEQPPLGTGIHRAISVLYFVAFLYGIVSLATGGYTIAMFIVRLVYYEQWANKAQFEWVQILTMVPVCLFYMTFVTDALMRHVSNQKQLKMSSVARTTGTLASQSEYEILDSEDPAESEQLDVAGSAVERDDLSFHLTGGPRPSLQHTD